MSPFSSLEDVESREQDIWSRLGAMAIIFFVSLFASSFPSLSKHLKFLHIPRIAFFIAKHFGTGIILSTAFGHLLQDAFQALQSPVIKQKLNIGDWTGMIVLSSLLAIFLVEYICTAYVDHLNSPTSPPSPSITPPTPPNQRTPLLRNQSVAHRHPHSNEFPCLNGMTNKDDITASPSLRNEEYCTCTRENTEREHDDDDHTKDTKVGRKRQIIGILILQLGIMIHSVVIGLTLSLTSGSQFASLLTAVIFHQLFEGLSLGIRISTLSAPNSPHGSTGALKFTLAFLFAITTPIGIVVGLLLFVNGDQSEVHMKMIKGLTSALSAGLLIYASTTEMLAGDFVMDQQLWRSSFWKQFSAIASLLVGVVVMGVLIK